MYFTGIIGLDSVKQALLLLAVDARLGGCILSAPVGAGKSLLARAYADLMPERTPFIELPLNVTEDRLLGGLDLEATLSTGQRTLQRGLLSAAHGGALYVDALNLLDSAAEAALIEALTRGEAIVERDGISARHPARFVLIGTYCPAEGELRRGLADRVALIVPFVPGASAEARVAVMSGQLAAAAPQLDEPALHDDALAMLRGLLNDARARLASVVMHDTQVLALARLADSLGVEGNRADVFAAYAAQASAALAQRGTVEDEDLALAARLVLVPRATRLPEREEQTAQAEPPSAPQPQPTDVSDAQQDSLPQTDDRQVEEMLFAALQGDLPADVMTLPFVAARRSRSGSRGIALNASRGRMVRTVEGRRGRIAVLATLLAAAPWQQLRRTERSQQRSRIIVRAADLRVKRFRDKAGTLFVFVVDASGSMALNRMREAKGAAAKLLQNAYVHRDQVALIGFRGRQAEVLLPPSASVERAKRALDVLPTGGGTPLASALLTGWQLARGARGKGVLQTALVLMTDGRANVPLRAAPGEVPTKAALQEEVRLLATLLRADGIASVVIDTQSSHVSRGEATMLAAQLGGRYVYLPNARAERIAQEVMAA